MNTQQAGYDQVRCCSVCKAEYQVMSQRQGAGPVGPEFRDAPFILTDTECPNGHTPLLLHRPGELEVAQPSLFDVGAPPSRCEGVG